MQRYLKHVSLTVAAAWTAQALVHAIIDRRDGLEAVGGLSAYLKPGDMILVPRRV